MLAVDASEDASLALSCGNRLLATVKTLVEQANSLPLSREAIDWALHDLLSTAPVERADGEADLLVWGQLSQELTPAERDVLEYGLPRLIRTYDVVLWDGPLGVAETILERADIRHLIVITPEDESYCQQQVEIDGAMVLLSKAQAVDVLPPTAASQIQKGKWRFLGKLPPLSPPEKRIKELPQYFQDCFHKLDLPFELRSQWV